MYQVLTKTDSTPVPQPVYPTLILRAMTVAQHLEGLSPGLRGTLAELCSYLPQKSPQSTIFAHKRALAKRQGISEGTAYRHLKGLNQHGLIELLPQERKSCNGRFAVARIQLTSKAIQALGFTEHHGNHRLPSFKPTTRPPQTPRQSLPDDLKWLTTQGLSKPAIFKLMGRATQKNKRLSDITAATLHALWKLHGNDLYAYLSALIEGPQDFALAAQQQRQRGHAKAQEEQHAQQDQAFKDRFTGVSLINKEQTRRYQIGTPTADYLSVFEKSTPQTPRVSPLNAAWIGFLKTGLGQGQLILATEARKAKWLSGALKLSTSPFSEKHHQAQAPQGVIPNSPSTILVDGYTLSKPTNSITSKTVDHLKSVPINFSNRQTIRPISYFLSNCRMPPRNDDTQDDLNERNAHPIAQ